MTRIVAALFLFLALAVPAAAQIPGGSNIQLHITPITGGAVLGDCLTVGTGNTVSQAVCGGAPSGAAGGVLSGTYPNPGFATSPTFTGTVTIPTPFTLGAVSVTTTGTRLNYLTSAGGTTGTTSTNVVFSTSPTLVTPALGVATATSVAIGGATIGSNALAVTGTTVMQGLTLGAGFALALGTEGTITTNGTGVFLMRASGSVGGVINLATDSTFKLFGRDGTTQAIVQAGTLALGGATIGSNALAVTGSGAFSTTVSGTGYLSTGSTPGNGGSCGVTFTGGATAGRATLVGACAAGTLVPTLPTSALGWACTITNQTLSTRAFNQTASGTTSSTWTGTGNSGDVLAYNCMGY